MSVSKYADSKTYTYNVLAVDIPENNLPEDEKKVRLAAATYYPNKAQWTLLKYAEYSANIVATTRYFKGQGQVIGIFPDEPRMDRIQSIVKEAKEAIGKEQAMEKEFYASSDKLCGDPVFFFSEMALIKVAKIEALGGEKSASATLENAKKTMEEIRKNYFQRVYKDPADYEPNFIRGLVSAAKIEASFDKDSAYKTLEQAQQILKSFHLSDSEDMAQMETRIEKAKSKIQKM